MSDVVPKAAKAFGPASPRPLGVAWDTRDRAFKVLLSAVEGRVFSFMLLVMVVMVVVVMVVTAPNIVSVLTD